MSSAVSQAGQGNEFAVPDVADTEAGAKFFAQHALDLAWAVGQEFIAREYESFTELVVEGIQKADWSNNDAKLAEASLLFTKSMKHRAERVRDIADQNHPVIFETMLCRYVDNFLSYVADLLGVIMVLNPRALANRDSTISLKDVLNHDTMESLHEWLVDRKVNDLTFQGFGRIVEYYKTKFDFILVTDQNIERTITMAVATRNLLVHKRGIIDSRFLEVVGADMGRVGQRVRVADRIWTEFLPAILACVRDTDKRAADKFCLQSAMVFHDQRVVEDHERFMRSLIEEVLNWSRS